ncbi:MAG: hypothetical protein ABIN58_13310 [candidate division WOR-3 bacterium]
MALDIKNRTRQNFGGFIKEEITRRERRWNEIVGDFVPDYSDARDLIDYFQLEAYDIAEIIANRVANTYLEIVRELEAELARREPSPVL